MSHSNFLHLILDWAKKCVELIRFQKAWQTGRVPEEELAEHVTAPLLDLDTDLDGPAEKATGKGSKRRGKKSLGSGKKKEAVARKDIEIQVYGVGAPASTARVAPSATVLETASTASSVTTASLTATESEETELALALEKASEKSFALIVEKSEETSFPGRPTLLVIDDYQPLREMIARAFRGNRYNVCAAKDGVEGIVRIHENDIDLIITDVQMPRLDGFEMSKMLNVREKTREIPVIFLTEVLDDQTKAVAKRLGAADTLVKPFTMDALFESARTILRSHSKLDDTPEAEVSRAVAEPAGAGASEK